MYHESQQSDTNGYINLWATFLAHLKSINNQPHTSKLVLPPHPNNNNFKLH